jgi:hypothetical protein
MKTWKIGVRWWVAAGVFAAAVAGAPAAEARGAEASRAGRDFKPPAECAASKIALTPRALSDPYWLFVLNFDVVRGGRPVGCVLIYPKGSARPVASLPVPCAINGPEAALAAGVARLDGATVACAVNLRRRINGLGLTGPGGETIVLDSAYDYQRFSIIGYGRLEGRDGKLDGYGNPIVSYQPARKSPPVSLFAPLFSLASGSANASASLTVRYTDVEYASAGCANPRKGLFTVSASRSQSWAFLLGAAPRSAHLLADQGTLCAFSKAPAVKFRTDGGTFLVGGSTLGSSFRGQLDEIVVDPTGGTRPPGSH